MRRVLIVLIILFGVHTLGQTRVGIIGRAAPSPGASTISVSQTSWGLVANPADDSTITTAAAYRANSDGLSIALARSVAAGVDHVQEVYRWTDIEATLGIYDFTKIDTLVDHSGTLPLVLNIAPIWDDGNTSLPATLVFTNFSEAAVTNAYKNMLTALAGHLDQRLYVLLVGNEVDTYLTTESRRTQYATFLTSVRTHARTLFGTNPFKVATTLRSVTASSWSDWVDIDIATDINSFTYYPNDASVSFAADTLTDLTNMTTLGPVMFQEIGLSSSASGGTPALQSAGAQTLVGYISLLVSQQKSIPVVTWSQLSDLSASVISSFGYSSGQFTSGLGLRDTSNAAKTGFVTLCAYFGGVLCSDPPPPACEFSLSLSSVQATAAGVTGTLQLTASASSCAWTRTIIYDPSASGWLTFLAASGAGSATLTYTAAINSATAGRSAQVIVAGKNFTITQDGAIAPPPPPPTCTFTASKTEDTFTASAGSDTVTSTASNASCPWTASVLDGVTWLSLNLLSGTGNSTLTYSVTANTGTASRIGRFTFGDGDILTVTQDGDTTPPPPPPPIIPDCNSTTTSPTGVTPLLNYTPCRQDTWNRMYACYLLNPSNPPSGQQGSLDCGDGMGGKWMKLIKNNADCNCRYYDIGQFDAHMYQVTGDATYATKAYNKVLARQVAVMGSPKTYIPESSALRTELRTGQPVLVMDLNVPREDAIRIARILNWISPAISASQRNTILANQIEQMSAANRWQDGHRIGDSDQNVGLYFGIVLTHLANPTYQPATDLYNTLNVGGLTQTIAVDDFDPNLAAASGGTMRNSLAAILWLATGGEWIESSDYNTGTGNLVLEGYDAVKTATGVDYYPEITAWLPKWAQRWLAFPTPDLNNGFMWGDEQDVVRDVLPHKRNYTFSILTAAGLLQGTTEGRRLQGLMLDLIAKYGYIGNGSMEPISNPSGAFVLYNPYDQPDTWRTQKFFYASGVGIVQSRSGTTTGAITDSSFFVHLGGPRKYNSTGTAQTSYDHVNLTLGNWQLYRNGHFAITHPIAYQSAQWFREGNNGSLVHGVTSVVEFNGAYHAVQNNTFTYTTATSGGTMFGSGGYAGFYRSHYANEITREIFYFPPPSVGGIDTVIVADRFNVLNPVPDLDATDLTFYHLGSCEGPDPCRGNVERFAALSPTIFVLHTDKLATQVGRTFSWTTSGSESAKLTTVFPTTIGSSLVDEVAYTATDQVWTGIPTTERKFHIKVYPPSYVQFSEMLNLIQVGGNGVATGIEDAGKARALHLTRVGEPDALVVVNAQSGGTISQVGWDPTHRGRLETIAYQGQGYTIPWTGVASSTFVVLSKLHPGVTWTLNIDHAGANTIVPDVGGIYTFTVSGSGTHTFTTIGTGAPPPPDVCPMINISPASPLANGTYNVAYSIALSSTGGSGSYSYIRSSGILPTGLSLSTGGVLSGTPTTAGDYSFTVSSTDSSFCVGTRVYALTIDAVAPSTDIARATGFYVGATAWGDFTGSSTGSFAFVKVGAGSSRIGILTVMGDITDTLTGCTVDGAAATFVNKVRIPTDRWMYLYYRLSPGTGDRSVGCTFSTPTAHSVLWNEYWGVNQTTPINASTSFTGTDVSAVMASVTTTNINTWTVITGHVPYSSTQTPAPGVGSNFLFSGTYGNLFAFDFGPHDTTGVKTMEATVPDPTIWGGFIFALNPVP